MSVKVLAQRLPQIPVFFSFLFSMNNAQVQTTDDFVPLLGVLFYQYSS